MWVYLYRHGLTTPNEERRYLGRTDAPLSENGRASLSPVKAPANVECAYISPMARCRQTAEILFPKARLTPVPDFREMDFGSFEMRTADEMAHDSDYRVWVDGMCEGRCPGGEDRATFCARTERAFIDVFSQADQNRPLVIIAHGGTIMAIMACFASPHRDYWSWHTPPGGRISALAETEGRNIILRVQMPAESRIAPL